MKIVQSMMGCASRWSEEMVELMKSEVHERWKCSSLEKFGLGEKFCLKVVLDPLWLKKSLFVLSHPSSSLTLQKQMAQMRLKGSNFGVYIHAWRQRVAQEPLKNWLETIEFILIYFPLSPINDQIRYPHWNANNFGLPH